jgi:hypothetical protein
VAGTGLEPLLAETARLLLPLRRAVEDTDHFATFLRRFGYAPDPEVLAAGWAGLTGLRDTLDDMLEALAGLPPREELGAADLAPLAGPVRDAVAQVRDVAAAGSALADLGVGTEFPGELLDLLLHDHLRARAPILPDLLRALGVLEAVQLSADGGDGRDVDAVLVRFRWSRLRQLLTDGGAWAEDVYGWGVAFDADLAITRIVTVLDWVGPYATLEPMSDAQTADLVRNHPADDPTPTMARAALIGTDLTDLGPEEALQAFAEAGLALLPFGDVARPDRFGLALAPYVEGAVAASTELSETLSLLVDVDASALGGAVLALTPDGLSVEGDASVSASFELGLRMGRADGSPIVLIGTLDGTRLEIDAALVSVGGALDGDLFLAGGVEQLRAVIDLGDDGLLGSVVDGPVTLDAGDVLAGWRPGRGIYLEGGTSLAVLIPLGLDLGPLRVHELALELEVGDPVALALTVEAEARVGPLFAYVEGLGLRAALLPTEAGDGLLGTHDVAFSLVPPTGYAIELDAGAIAGGGMLAADDGGYRGALAFTFGEIGFSAFGLLRTEVPDSDVPFAFVASVFGEFTLPLGFGFFLTGLGGIVGIHRTVDTGALREVLYEGRLDDQLFPADPIANADTILDDMDAIYPVAEGRHLFGPVARVSWGQPALVDGKLGIVLEVGASVRLLILGSLSSVLPDRDAALVELHLSFFGEIDVAAQTIEFDATLANSRVLTFGISGEMALRSGWAPGIDHVLSFGGLHPDYPRPDNLPDLQRLSISFGTNNPRVSLLAYLAVTVNSFQFGARATVYVKGPRVRFVGQVAVEGNIYFDALIMFNPFAFDVSLGGSLELLVDDEPKLEVGFDLRLRGPNRFMLDGKAWARVFKIKVNVPISHRWGEPESLPGVTTDPAELLVDTLRSSDGFDGLGTSARSSGVSFRSPDAEERRPADPVGGLRLSQRAVPLGAPIEKVGEAKIAGGAATFDLRLVDDAGLTVRDVHQDFARGQYYELSEAERLRAPSFERMKSGLEVAPDDLLVDEEAAIEATHDYEVIVIGADEEDEAPIRIVEVADLSPGFVARWTSSDIASVATPRTRRRAPAADAIRLADAVRGPAATPRDAHEEPGVAEPGGHAPFVAATLHGQPAHAAYVLAAAGAGGGR